MQFTSYFLLSCFFPFFPVFFFFGFHFISLFFKQHISLNNGDFFERNTRAMCFNNGCQFVCLLKVKNGILIHGGSSILMQLVDLYFISFIHSKSNEFKQIIVIIIVCCRENEETIMILY